MSIILPRAADTRAHQPLIAAAGQMPLDQHSGNVRSVGGLHDAR
jgi:hypothetical protein